MPEILRSILPANTNLRELVDLEHLLGYLDDVVDACEPPGDPSDWKGWYQNELLRDDGAIDRIWRNLRRKAKTLPRSASAERDAEAAALRYIRRRKDKMRYASHYAANLALGSGATEGTYGLMQTRVKRRGQSWEVPDLRGILTIRGLVLSARWNACGRPTPRRIERRSVAPREHRGQGRTHPGKKFLPRSFASSTSSETTSMRLELRPLLSQGEVVIV